MRILFLLILSVRAGLLWQRLWQEKHYLIITRMTGNPDFQLSLYIPMGRKEFLLLIGKSRSWGSSLHPVLECENKWALGRISKNRASGGDRIPLGLFQILKDDAVKVLYSICQKIWKTQQWPQDWKRSVFTSIPKKGNAKECSNNHTITLISYASKVMLKILQARPQQYVNQEIPDVQDGFRKGRGIRDQFANICWITEKARAFQKNISTCASLTITWKPLTVDHNCGKFLKKWECQTTLPASWETSMQVRKQVRTGHGTMDWFKLGKDYVKDVYCPLAYLNYMHSTSCKMLGWMNHNLELRLPRETSTTSDMQMIPP